MIKIMGFSYCFDSELETPKRAVAKSIVKFLLAILIIFISLYNSGMNENLQQKIKLSILVVCRNVSEAQAAFEISFFESKDFQFEIFIAEGDNPSLQRNELARQAEGDYLLFLDDDSIPDKNIFNAYAEALKFFPKAGVVGGPSLLSTEKNNFGILSRLFFSTLIGLGPFRSRYVSLGHIREASERELVLCNLLIKRDLVIKTGGFHRNFYPSEENEFLKRIKRSDPSFQMIYQPAAVVTKKARASLAQFARQLFFYGQGRSKHINLLKDPADIIFLLPSTLLFYLIFLLVCTLPLLFFLPLGMYFVLVAITTLKKNKPSIIVNLMAPLFFLLGHLFYGAGFFIGIIKYLLIKRVFWRNRKIGKLNVLALKKFTK